jgi:uncharacterized protein
MVCREKTDKRRLSRLVRTDDGVLVDASGRLAGRGAYLCDRPACWDRALQSGILERALRTTLSPETRLALAEHRPQDDD